MCKCTLAFFESQEFILSCSVGRPGGLLLRSEFNIFSIHTDTDNRDFKVQRRDGNKNVAYKVNLFSFSLYIDYSYPLTLSVVGEPS